jgi:hypothetical protein
VFEPGSDITLTAVAVDPKGYISRVEFYANEQLIGVSEIVFIRAPDPGTPITHTYLWPQVSAGEYVITARGLDAQGQVVSSRIKILVGNGGGGGGGTSDQVVVTIEAADAFAAETTESGTPDNALFIVRRIAGPKDVEVPVMLKISGTAVNGIDFAELKEMVVLRAGSTESELVIQPIPDKAIETEETIEISLVEPACPAIFPPPPQCYLIKGDVARAVIRDQSSGPDIVPTVTILPPKDHAKLEQGRPLEIKADAIVKGKSCVLESSTDLKTWTPVAPVILPDGQLTYVTEAGTDKQRYYRLRVQ